jgi:hypothetical protein
MLFLGNLYLINFVSYYKHLLQLINAKNYDTVELNLSVIIENILLVMRQLL